MIKLQDNIISDKQAVSTTSDVILEVANLKKGFGKQEVLKNISLKLLLTLAGIQIPTSILYVL